MRRRHGAGPSYGADADAGRIWWTDVGVQQNLPFAVHPDPVSGMRCWHQAVRVVPAHAGDRYGDISVDTGRARQIYDHWIAKARAADIYSPDPTRRPFWLVRPLKPARHALRLPPQPEPTDGSRPPGLALALVPALAVRA